MQIRTKAVVLSALLAASVGQLAAYPVLTVGSAILQEGSVFTIPVRIDGAGILTSWQFDFVYDPLALRVLSVSEGPLFRQFGASMFNPGVNDEAAGIVSLITNAYVDLPPEPFGDGVLANIELFSLGISDSTLTLSNVFLNLDDSHFMVAAGQVTSVPEPASYLLVPAALAALVISRQRNARRV